MRRDRPRLSTGARARLRRGRLLWASGLIVAILGVGHGGLQWWGDLAWFRRELSQPPMIWWALPSNLIFWTFGVGVLWAMVAGFVAENERKGDRRRWWLGFPGVALVATVSLAGSYVASRSGVALYPGRIAVRAEILDPLSVVAQDRVEALAVQCQMVRRPRSVRADDLIDRPTFFLILEGGRRARLGGVRGAGVGDLSQPRWILAMRQLSSLPRRVELRESECVSRAVARFPAGEQAFVRSLFSAPVSRPREVIQCAPRGGPERCVAVPLAPGPLKPRPLV